MRIACPTCAAAYDVPDALLAAGPRLLRCARCSTEFPAALPEAKAPPEPQPEPEPQPALPPDPAPPEPSPTPAPPADLAAPPRERPVPTRGPAVSSPIDALDAPAPPGQGRLTAAWIASFGAIGAGLFALVHWQAEIAAAWPPAARLYAVLGLS
jgi:predicted Zn finger-like uncharacterized protein